MRQLLELGGKESCLRGGDAASGHVASADEAPRQSEPQAKAGQPVKAKSWMMMMMVPHGQLLAAATLPRRIDAPEEGDDDKEKMQPMRQAELAEGLAPDGGA